MKTSKRLEHAITKLYNAFHNNQLHPDCCIQCAVGNICDHTDTWKLLTIGHGSLQLSYLGTLNQNFGRKIFGYTPLELLQIEAEFLKGCGYSLPITKTSSRPKNPKDKALQFNGLCRVVALLCKFDNVPNVMEISKLFEVEHNSPKYQLQF
ncbi:Na(+)-translocating NADH-quinone reductase subunit F [Bizionia paragorgiae]|uniref:Na(+)-translocating NADH-quinone reductase subunit F n=1 Tax=Bizionia paragorgiae TaxID=283786 RepID=UPI003A93D28F